MRHHTQVIFISTQNNQYCIDLRNIHLQKKPSNNELILNVFNNNIEY